MAAPEAILFYDARCTLCTMWKDGVAASNSTPIRFADANDPDTARQLGVTDAEQLRHRMCLLKPDGVQAWGFDAVVELLSLSGGGQAVAALLSVPAIARLGRRVYDWVAQTRSCSEEHTPHA